MAGPTVKISAYNSKPSNSQPRLAASRMFHWWRGRPRYHGYRRGAVSVMGIPPCLRISQRRPFQSRRAAAARLCLQPLLSLPTGLTLPEPAGGDLRILLDGGSAPSPDVGRRVAAPIIPNAGMLQAAR